MSKKNLIRIEQLLVDRGHAPSLERARALIMAGEVFCGNQRVASGAQRVELDCALIVRGADPFVSRGGLKLDGALSAFSITVTGRVCADVGAATGGFSDAMLQRGAIRVYAVDVGYGDLHWKVRSDARVIPIERTNARHLLELPEKVSLIAADVSFISVTALYVNFYKWLGDSGDVVVLVKPQFEAEQAEASAGEGVITDPAIHRRVIRRACELAQKEGFSLNGLIASPIQGVHGNQEFLLWLGKGATATRVTVDQLLAQVQLAY